MGLVCPIINVMDNFYAAFGTRLKSARNRANMSQSDLAKRVSLSRTSITNIERGHQQVSLKLAVSLARELHVQLDELLESGHSQNEVSRLTEEVNREHPGLSSRSKEWVTSLLQSEQDEQERDSYDPS